MRFKPRGIIEASLLTTLIVSGISICVFAGVVLLMPHTQRVTTSQTPPPTIALDPSLLAADAAVLYDPTTGTILFAKNATVPLPLASLTKLATAQTVLAGHPEDQTIVINRSDLLQQDQADLALHAGDRFSLSQLLRLALIGSSNDAMAAVAASVGTDTVQKMNSTASQLGLTDSVFYDPTGLDLSSTTSGAYASARDVAVLASVFYREHPDYFELTERPSVSVPGPRGNVLVQATDAPLLSVPNLVGAKTGYTTLAGGNLVAIFDVQVGHPLVAVVLGSTEKGRFTDMRTLIAAAEASL